MEYIPDLPITVEQCIWINQAFAWLLNTFGHETLIKKRTLVTEWHCFPFNYEPTMPMVHQVAEILAEQMDIDYSLIEISTYKEGEHSVGGSVLMQGVEGEQYSGGKYYGLNNDGKYHIALRNDSVGDLENLVAVLAHEMAHIKLLGEANIDVNNEPLTDLTTLFYGIGVYNANMAFKHTGAKNYWSIQKLGYLQQVEWGYALALRSYILGEGKVEWPLYLNPTVRADYKESMAFFDEVEFELEPYTEATPPEHPLYILPITEKVQDIHKENYDLAIKLYKDEKVEDAAEMLYQIAIANCNYKQAYGIALYTLLITEQYQKAASLIENSTPIEFTDNDLMNAGFVYLKLKQFEKAYNNFDAVVGANPFNAEALNNLGFALIKLKRYNEALEYLNDAIEYEPNHAFAYNNRGLAKIKTTDMQGGLADIQYSLKLMPDNAYSYRNLGVYYLAMGNNAMALSNFNIAKQLDPTVDEIDELIDACNG